MEKMGYEESLEIITEQLMKRETERLMKRDAERHRELVKKREEREKCAASDEKLDLFFEAFETKKQEIEDSLDRAATGYLEKSELPFHFDGIVKSIQSLQNYISSSSYFLRMYDIRKTQETLQILQQKCQEIEENLLPKKKFSFQARKSASKSKKERNPSKGEERIGSSSIPKPQSSFEERTVCGFSNKISEHLTLNEEDILKKDVVLSNLEKCTVRLPGVPSTLHITNLHQSRILCGPVVTSVLIEDCMDCTFVLACQQLRIHNSRHCDFYLHVSSRAIIEDTKEVRFSPYVWKYENVDRHFNLAGLDMNKNNWDFIDDFNWLACDKPSPHWRVLKVSEQNLDWISNKT